MFGKAQSLPEIEQTQTIGYVNLRVERVYKGENYW